MEQKLKTYEFQGMFHWIMIYDENQADLKEIKEWLDVAWEPGPQETYLINRLNSFDMGFDFIIVPPHMLEILKKWNKK